MHSVTVTYTYADGSGNTYILTEQNVKILGYVPITAKESSSGVYHGGEPVQKQITDAQYAAFVSAIEKAIQNRSIHIEQREMKSGYIKIQKGAEESVYIIAPNAPEQMEIERVLKEAMSKKTTIKGVYQESKGGPVVAGVLLYDLSYEEKYRGKTVEVTGDLYEDHELRCEPYDPNKPVKTCFDGPLMKNAMIRKEDE